MVGEILLHYRIEEPLGAGGMGVVWRATDTNLGREVALKVLSPNDIADPIRVSRFLREARNASALNHPNIVTIFEANTAANTPFIAMEYVRGVTLHEELRGGPLGVLRSIEIALQICAALEHSHAAGIVHRDLKPGNIMLTPAGDVKVLDFGVAKHTAKAEPSEGDTTVTTPLTMAGATVGTIAYMSPEQALGDDVDARSDLFSLGVVLYEMISNARPFDSKSMVSVLRRVVHSDPTPLREVAPGIPGALEAVVSRCLEKERDDRYQSAAEITYALRAVRNEIGEAASALTATMAVAPARGRIWVRRLFMAVVSVHGPIGNPTAPTQSKRYLPRRQFVRTIGLSAAALTLAVVMAGSFWMRRSGKAAGTALSEASIAVLPFVDLSPEKNQEYFSDGLTEELLNGLAKTRGLRVAGSTSCFQFKGKSDDSRTIGAKLNVANILEGSVRKQGNRARIAVQLIKAADGFELWAETFDRDMNDIFAVEEEIGHAVADELKLTLLGKKTGASEKTANAACYSAYLQGRYFLERRSKENLALAVSYFEQAMKLDPGFAPAWVELGESRLYQASVAYIPLEEGYAQARDAVKRALELDPNLADAHVAMGSIKLFHDWDWTGADASYQRALELEPGGARVLRGAGNLTMALGRLNQAISLGRRATEIDPLSPGTFDMLARGLYYAGREEEATASLKRALELSPDQIRLHSLLSTVYLAQSRFTEALAEAEKEKHPAFRLVVLALAYHALGRKKESDANLAELMAKFSSDASYQIAEVYAFQWNLDRAFEWLERAYTERDGGLIEIKGDPLLKSLRRDARYAAFLEKMHLPI